MSATNATRLAPRLTFGNAGSTTGATLTQPYRGLKNGDPFPYNGAFNSGGTIFAIDRNYEWPYTYQLNLSLQRQFTKDWSVMAAYVGSLSHNLPFAVDINYPLSTPTASTAAANVLSRRPDTTSLPTVTPFGSILLMRSNQTASYHALQLSIPQTKR